MQTMVLINRTGKKVEFFYGGTPYIFEKGETRPVEAEVANHALKFVNTGLEELTPEIEKEEAEKETKVMPPYRDMPWRKLVSRMGKNFKPGMVKEDIVKYFEDKWQKKYGNRDGQSS